MFGLIVLAYQFASVGVAQNRDDRHLFVQLSSELDRLRTMTSMAHPGSAEPSRSSHNTQLTAEDRKAFNELWKDMAQDLFVLMDARGKVDNAYRDSVKLDEKALRRLDEPALPVQNKLKLCRDVAADLRAKRDYANSNSSLPFGLVTVTVHTLGGGKETGNLQVWYVPMAWEEDKD
jgi:hypothetical protein